MTINCKSNKYFLSILQIAILLFSNTTFAKDFPKAENFREHQITFLGAIGSYESISLLLKKIKLIPPYSYFIGVGYRSPEVIFNYIRLNVELIKHFGKQQSFEVTLYPSIESPAVYIGNLGFNFGICDGISVMVGPYPKFEEYRTVKTSTTVVV